MVNTSELKTIGSWVLLISVLMAQILFYTWCRIQCTQIGYEISEAADTHRELLTDQSNLQIELARLKSPDRIAKIAKYQLGLTSPAPEQMVIMSYDETR